MPIAWRSSSIANAVLTPSASLSSTMSSARSWPSRRRKTVSSGRVQPASSSRRFASSRSNWSANGCSSPCWPGREDQAVPRIGEVARLAADRGVGDRLAVDRVEDRLADPHVAQWLGRRVERELDRDGGGAGLGGRALDRAAPRSVRRPATSSTQITSTSRRRWASTSASESAYDANRTRSSVGIGSPVHALVRAERDLARILPAGEAVGPRGVGDTVDEEVGGGPALARDGPATSRP